MCYYSNKLGIKSQMHKLLGAKGKCTLQTVYVVQATVTLTVLSVPTQEQYSLKYRHE